MWKGFGKCHFVGFETEMRAVVIACTSDNTDKNCDVRSAPLTSYISIVIIPIIIAVITITTSFGDVIIIIIVVIIMMSGPLPRSSSIQTRIRGMTTMHTGCYSFI